MSQQSFWLLDTGGPAAAKDNDDDDDGCGGCCCGSVHEELALDFVEDNCRCGERVDATSLSPRGVNVTEAQTPLFPHPTGLMVDGITFLELTMGPLELAGVIERDFEAAVSSPMETCERRCCAAYIGVAEDEEEDDFLDSASDAPADCESRLAGRGSLRVLVDDNRSSAAHTFTVTLFRH